MKRWFKKASIGLVIVFLVQLLSILVAYQPIKVIATTTPPTLLPINILEVQPSRTFDFTNANFSSGINQRPVNLRQMSMSEFISNIDVINGNYDIVYIGNNTSGGAVPYTALGSKSAKLPPGSGNSAEYYSDNDITNKRANDVIEFINSGQCTIFASSLFSDVSLNSTKLYKNFAPLKNKANVKSIGAIDVNSIVDFYLNQIRRPQINITNAPTQYNGTNTSYITNRLLNFTYDVNNISNPNNALTAKLYMDFNGDGLFKEYELVNTKDLSGSGTNYSISYRVLETFNGNMPWRLVISDNSTTVKSCNTGSVAFMADSLNTPKVRVLQLYPDGNNFDLISNLKSALRVTGLYELNVTEMYIKDFNNAKANNYAPVKAKVSQANFDGTTSISQSITTAPTVLNGNYDMIILGFADVYGNNDLSNDAINDIKSFIATKQSVMFTHDLLTFQNNSAGSWDYNNTKQFRDYIGQSRYKDSNNLSELDIDGATKIIHDPYPSSAYSYGYTNPTLDRANTNAFITKTSAKKINGGVITDFPYKLPETGDISVATSHFQYYQLDLENENVIPWYTFNGYGGNTAYDGRNYYYTYSNGTITYSGTGHSSPNSSLQENQLFVNTMLKAQKSANHAPSLQVFNLTNGQNVSSAQDSLSFSFIPTDIDNDIINGEVKINGKQYSTYNNISSGNTVPVTISKADLEKFATAGATFTIEVNASDSHNAKADKQVFILNYINQPTVTLTNSLDKDGYLVGDIINDTVIARVNNSDSNLQSTISNFSFTQTNNSNLRLISGATWNLNDMIITGTNNLPAPQTNIMRFQVLNSGTYSLENTLSYKFNNLLGGATQIQPSSTAINASAGSMSFKIVDKKGSLVNNAVPLKITKSDGTELNISTVDGIATFNNLTSGGYKISANVPNGYTLTNSTMTPYDYATGNYGASSNFNLATDLVNMSYHNGNPLMTIILDAPIPVITVSHSPANGTITYKPVTVTIDFGENVLAVINKYYKEDGGIEKTYNGPFQENRNVTITAYATSNAGVAGQGSDKITNLDVSIPTGTVTYDKLNPTNTDVVATLGNLSKPGVRVTNNGGLLTHTFTNNGSFVFELIDELGITGTATAIVNNIDKIPLTATITYDKINATNGDVIATIGGFNKTEVRITNNEGANEYTFRENGTFPFSIIDAFGNTATIVAKVDWIDKAPITATVTYSETGPTNSNIVATIGGFNKAGVRVINNQGSNNYSFTKNGTFIFEVVDTAGNISSISAMTNWIDKTPPTGTISSVRNADGRFTLTLHVKDSNANGEYASPVGSIRLQGGGAANNAGANILSNEIYTFRFLDEAENVGSAGFDANGPLKER